MFIFGSFILSHIKNSCGLLHSICVQIKYLWLILFMVSRICLRLAYIHQVVANMQPFIMYKKRVKWKTKKNPVKMVPTSNRNIVEIGKLNTINTIQIEYLFFLPFWGDWERDFHIKMLQFIQCSSVYI